MIKNFDVDFEKMAEKCRDNAIYYYSKGDLNKGKKYEKDAKYFKSLTEIDNDSIKFNA